MNDANRDRFVGFGVRGVSGVGLGGLFEAVVAKVVFEVVGKHVETGWTKSGRGRRRKLIKTCRVLKKQKTNKIKF